VEEFRSQGYLAPAIVNYLTLLGWAPDAEQEIIDMPATVKEFELEKMSKKAAIYDTKKLTWLNGHYLNNLPLADIVKEAEPFFVDSGLVTDAWIKEHQEFFNHLIDVVRVRVKT
jgi:glutamyl-tRNA synthetase